MDIKVDTAISFLDIFIIIVLIWAIFKGYKRGPVVHALSLLVIVIGIAVFGYMAPQIGEFIREKVRSQNNLPYIHFYIFALLFAATVWLSNFVANRTEKASAKPKGIISILLGILASSVKYLYILSIFLLYFGQFDKSYEFINSEEKRRTKLYEGVKNLAPNTLKTVSFLDE